MKKIINNKWVVGIGLAVIGSLISNLSSRPSQSHSGYGDNVGRDKIVINQPVVVERKLNPSTEECLFKKIARFSPKVVEISPQTYPLEQRSTSTAFTTQTTSKEVENFSKELNRFFTAKGYEVINYMSLEPGSGVSLGITISQTDNSTVRILVGENDGSSICSE